MITHETNVVYEWLSLIFLLGASNLKITYYQLIHSIEFWARSRPRALTSCVLYLVLNNLHVALMKRIERLKVEIAVGDNRHRAMVECLSNRKDVGQAFSHCSLIVILNMMHHHRITGVWPYKYQSMTRLGQAGEGGRAGYQLVKHKYDQCVLSLLLLPLSSYR